MDTAGYGQAYELNKLKNAAFCRFGTTIFAEKKQKSP